MKIRVPYQNEDDTSDEHAHSWVEHPFTQRLKDYATKERDHALAQLLSAAKQSTDVKVVAHHAEYQHFRTLAEFAAGKWEKA